MNHQFGSCDDYILPIDLVSDFSLSERRRHSVKIVTLALVMNFAVFTLLILLGQILAVTEVVERATIF